MSSDRKPPSKQLATEASEALSHDDFDGALELANRALHGNDDEPGALRVKAFAEAQLKKFDDFRLTIDRLISNAPDDADPLILKGLVLLQTGDIADALSAASRATEIDPKDPDAWDTLSEALLIDTRAAEAIEAAEQAIKLSPDDPEYTLTLGRAAIENDEPQKARSAFEESLGHDPDNAEVLAALANAERLLGRPAEARALIDQAFELSPNSPSVLRIRGPLLALIGDQDDASSTFTHWAEIDPEEEDAWLGLGLACFEMDELEKALEAFRLAGRIAPEDSRIKRWIGVALRSIDADAEALQVFTELTESNADWADAWFEKGVTERQLGFSNQSIESLRTSLALEEFADSKSWEQLARSYSDAGFHHNAWRSFVEAARLDPEDPDPAIGQAAESIWNHRETLALRELVVAEERHGENALIEFNRGVAYYKLGKEGQACAAWRRALKLDPDLVAAEVLISNFSAQARPGGWVEHWFAGPASRKRKAGGGLLLMGLLFFLLLPSLRENLIPGVSTGTLSLNAFIPVFVLVLLLVLPTIRGLAVGGVSVDVAPTPTSGPDDLPRIDTDQIIPALQREDLDARRLISR